MSNPLDIICPAIQTAVDWVIEHSLYAKILVSALAFWLFSIGASKILRAWRK